MLKKIKGLKRAAALCMVICLILSLSACGGSQKAKEDSASATQDTQETAQDQQAQEEVSEVSEVPAAAETAIASADAAEAATIAAETAAADAAAAETAAAEIAASDATAAETAASDLLPDYSKEENWAYFALGEGKDVDLFLICPTVDTKDEYNMSMDDEEVKKSFFGALNMERGIYEDMTVLDEHRRSLVYPDPMGVFSSSGACPENRKRTTGCDMRKSRSPCAATDDLPALGSCTDWEHTCHRRIPVWILWTAVPAGVWSLSTAVYGHPSPTPPPCVPPSAGRRTCN